MWRSVCRNLCSIWAACTTTTAADAGIPARITAARGVQRRAFRQDCAGSTTAIGNVPRIVRIATTAIPTGSASMRPVQGARPILRASRIAAHKADTPITTRGRGTAMAGPIMIAAEGTTSAGSTTSIDRSGHHSRRGSVEPRRVATSEHVQRDSSVRSMRRSGISQSRATPTYSASDSQGCHSVRAMPAM